MAPDLRALIIFNPNAGQAEALRPELDGAAALWREAGWQVELRPTRCAGDATVLSREAAAAGYGLVAAAGGDGTVNEVVNGLVGSPTALAVLPCGTVNIWAREMGLSMEIRAAAAAFLTADRRLVDVGVCRTLRKLACPEAPRPTDLGPTDLGATDLGATDLAPQDAPPEQPPKKKKKYQWVAEPEGRDRYFLLMASAGFDAAVTAEVDLVEKRRFGAIAYLKSAFQLAWRYQGTKIHLRIDGRRIRGRVLMVVIGNSQLYGGVVKFTAHALVDDGFLDVCVIRGRSLLIDAPARLLSVFTRFYNRDPQVRYYRAKQVEILGKKKKKRLPVQVDGDYLGQTPMGFEVVEKGLWVMVPTGGGPSGGNVANSSLWSETGANPANPDPIKPVSKPTVLGTVLGTSIGSLRVSSTPWVT